jgi:DNA-binding response OmpR family regulator
LVVEDEVLICLLIETMLEDAGYDVTVANSVREALDSIGADMPDVAILDLTLHGEKVYPVADKLTEAGTPFVFATGGGRRDIEGFPDQPWVAKPFQEHELLATVGKLVGKGRPAA